VFYIEPPPCQPLFFSVFRLRKAPKNVPAYCLLRGAHSTLNRFPVNRFLKNPETQFLQYFQTVTSMACRCVSGLFLRSGAHSTGVRKTVNAVFELIPESSGFHL
ncbi:hypothetical protein, partial [Marinobacter sp. F4206]|uniref:hypothetical protein n=1 Tax=Marinobacter sp. F4206 TaxID=2861777 RepID=UPI001C60653A